MQKYIESQIDFLLCLDSKIAENSDKQDENADRVPPGD
jgi:hypothetical protein